MAQLQRLAIAPVQLQGQQVVLTAQQLHYLSHVLRLRAGDRIILMDGQGNAWLAALAATNAEILQPLLVQTELSVSITLLMALPKGNGFDEVVRYCTELGVNCLAPVISDRTLLKPSPQKLERWRRIAQEAAEQSERLIVPTILEPIAFSTAISTATAAVKYICVARGNYPHLKNAIASVSKTSEIVIAIGSEGGWTTSEVELAQANNFISVSLGKRIFRAVTAPIVALSLLAAAFEI